MKDPTAGPQDRLYSFGGFVADPVTGTLRLNGSPVALTLKSFEVLMVLLERRGQVVEKDALLKLVWPDTIVEENNLARHISTLRKALNDQPHDHQFIVTIPGRGYRFVAQVQEFARGEVPPQPAPAQRPQEPVAQQTDHVGAPRVEAAVPALPRQRRAAGLVAASVTAAAITVIVLGNFPRAERETPDRKLWQLTSSGGLESDATWAPDGQTIAYSSDREGSLDIWTQPIGEGHPVRLVASPAHEWQPSWSPDGRSLAFRSERDGGGLFVVSATGGPERRITNFGYRPQWSRHEPTILFYSSNIIRSKLYVVGADGTQLRRVLAEFIDEFSSYRAAWHPDGRRISVFGVHRRHGVSFWTASLDGAAPVQSTVGAPVARRMKNAGVNFTEFNWSPLANALYFQGQSEGAVNIWRITVEPQTLEWTDGPARLTLGGGLDTNIALSSDGQKLAFTVRQEKTRLWSFPFDPVEGRVLGGGEPVSAPGADALYPDVPADGSKVAYRTMRRGKHELHSRSLVDGKDTVLTSGEELMVPRWSNDGKQLAFRRMTAIPPERTRKENSVVLMSADGSHERSLTTADPREITPYDWSSDGLWILGSCEHGPAALTSVCLLPVSSAPRAREQMRIIAADPERDLYQATFSPNQRWIAFNATTSMSGLSSIYVVGAEGGQWTPISEGTFWDDKPRWSPDGRTIYFVSNRSGFLNVWGRRVDPASGKPSGAAFRVTNFEHPNERVSSPVNTMELAIAPNQMVLPIVEASGAVWVLEGIDR